MSAIRPMLAAGLFLLACSSTITDPNSLVPEGENEPGKTGPAVDCAVRCENLSKQCSDLSAASCKTLCDSLSESKFECVENAWCDFAAFKRCFETPEPVRDGGSNPPANDGGTTKPPEVTITAHFGSVKATHLMSSDKTKLYSSLSVAPKPTFSPALSFEFPNVTKAESFTVTSPSKGSCNVQASFTLSSSQIGVSMTLTDVLPSAACATFTDAVASKGLNVTLHNVPYPNGGVASKVIINLSP